MPESTPVSLGKGFETTAKILHNTGGAQVGLTRERMQEYNIRDGSPVTIVSGGNIADGVARRSDSPYVTIDLAGTLRGNTEGRINLGIAVYPK